jgi:hypothetical protein
MQVLQQLRPCTPGHLGVWTDQMCHLLLTPAVRGHPTSAHPAHCCTLCMLISTLEHLISLSCLPARFQINVLGGVPSF